MSKREALTRYSLIINRIKKSPCSLQDIKHHLQTQSEIQGYNFNISTRTFQRDLEDIRQIYKIDIQYKPSIKGYEIEEEDNQPANDRILEAFDIFNILQIGAGYTKHIHFENRKPQGTEHLLLLLHAIKHKLRLQFSYQKFEEEQATERLVEPYALKEFKQRWYLVAKELSEEKIKLFALDRLQEPHVTKKSFPNPDFDVEEYFRFCYGIIHQEGRPQENIILSFTAMQGMYMKSLPLHQSQKILVDNEEELRIELCVFPTYDLLMELLGMGTQLRVLQPQSLAQQLLHEHSHASKKQMQEKK